MSASGPLVSIVIPSFNHSAYLAAAIDSVLGQDYPRVELIVLDDGSTDGSAAILDRYGTRFHWERQPNQGQAATMNRGWRMAKGEILGYLGADDLLLPQAVSTSVSALRRNPQAVAVYCDFILIGPDSAPIRRVRAPRFDYRQMVTRLICHPGPGAFFRRAAFEQAGEWRGAYRQYGDYEFWLRLGLQGSFVHVGEVLAHYRVHPGSQSFAAAPPAVAEEPVRLMEGFFGDPRLPAELRALRAEAMSSAHLHSARLLVRAGHYRRGLAAARRAIDLYPRSAVTARTWRLAANALFNRIGHRLLWSARRVLRRGA